MKDEQDALNAEIAKIPAWRRWLICLLDRKAARVAQAYNVVACDLLMGEKTWGLGDDIRKCGNRKWSALYGLPVPLLPQRTDLEREIVRARGYADGLRDEVVSLRRSNALWVKTFHDLKKLRRQRPLPLP